MRHVAWVFSIAVLYVVPTWGAVQYVDASAAAKLNHITQYGSVFDSLTLGEMMMLNMGQGAAVGDYDNDGDLDVYLLAALGHSNRLFNNDLVAGEFNEMTGIAGVADPNGLGRMAHFVDLDDDGWLDLLLINDDDGSGMYSPSRIFRNDGNGSFSDVTAGSGFHPVGYLRCGATVGDYDNDGLLDIYITNWGHELGLGSPDFPGDNRLYRNLGNFRFKDVTMETHLTGLNRDSFSAIFVDLASDGYPDLFVAVDHTSDEFYRNLGGLFVNSTVGANLAHVGNDMGVACGDVDNDGDLDLYATNIHDPDFFFGYPPRTNPLHINQFDTTGVNEWVDEGGIRGVEDTYWGWGTEFSDVDNDGDLDLIAATGFDEFIASAGPPNTTLLQTPTVLFLNDSTGYFTRQTPVGLETGYDSRGLTAFDRDRDGDEDLLLTNVDQPTILYDNVSTGQGHWLSVALVQFPGNNRNGIGATVWATTGGTTQRRDIIVGDSFLSGGAAEAHFGLGSSTSVDVVVGWTDGLQTSFPAVGADQLVTLSQPLVDDDLDGVHDGHDCDPANNALWAVPGPVDNLALTGTATTTLTWTAADPGATSYTYDLLRATGPSDLASASCLLQGSSATMAQDSAPTGGLWVYVVRVTNACGEGVGRDSDDGDRTLPVCP